MKGKFNFLIGKRGKLDNFIIMVKSCIFKMIFKCKTEGDMR